MIDVSSARHVQVENEEKAKHTAGCHAKIPFPPSGQKTRREIPCEFFHTPFSYDSEGLSHIPWNLPHKIRSLVGPDQPEKHFLYRD